MPQPPARSRGQGGGWGRTRRWPCLRPAVGLWLEREGSTQPRGLAGVAGAREGATLPARGGEKPEAGEPGTPLDLERGWKSAGDPGA